ncbi:DUF6233 domain-containing protein, partial [Actinacidiphila sp. bgisy160]|uniref:DUF6233 domain-containing protein n=1 Tax=Actinacidiphila sp. bgisy160 TaxID=3413796 RepID=UPI003D742ACA
MHRRECWIDNGEELTAAEASQYAARPAVELCRLCRPDPPLGPLPTCASAHAAAWAAGAAEKSSRPTRGNPGGSRHLGAVGSQGPDQPVTAGSDGLLHSRRVDRVPCDGVGDHGVGVRGR